MPIPRKAPHQRENSNRGQDTTKLRRVLVDAGEAAARGSLADLCRSRDISVGGTHPIAVVSVIRIRFCGRYGRAFRHFDARTSEVKEADTAIPAAERCRARAETNTLVQRTVMVECARKLRTVARNHRSCVVLTADWGSAGDFGLESRRGVDL